MSVFSEAELASMAEGARLGRLATVDGSGMPHVVPVGWRGRHDVVGAAWAEPPSHTPRGVIR